MYYNNISEKKTFPPRRFRYQPRLVQVVLRHLDDDDFFMLKRFHWEDWVAIRLDITRAKTRLGVSGPQAARKIAAYLNKEDYHDMLAM